ncbi:hypothetical protein GDO81_011969 [Engystomops pustulosus]|uniref:Uncharacterized protein n=1 Tax=Engystomops pustulosus TaxID=76066 RepID=A0AAV7BIF9_ENGPU|nr:hypothetical protein GDO81_011969 [Engystomops pustulosus]
MTQYITWDPSFSRRAVISCSSEYQKHVLLITCQNLNNFSLVDIDLIFFHCCVIMCHQHRGNIATSTVSLRSEEKKRKHTKL